MKKIILGLLAVLLIGGAIGGWLLFGPTVKSPAGKYIYIPTGSDYAFVQKTLKDSNITSNPLFSIIARHKGLPENVKPGRYEIKKGMNVNALVNMLRYGLQSPVRLTITKLRTRQDLAYRLGRLFEFDSTAAIQFLSNADSLNRLGVDTHTVMTLVIPNTYNLNWNTSMPKVMDRLKTEQEKFWTEERRNKAREKGLTTNQVYTIASIVEEETNKDDEKGNVASVYINRINMGMKLQADPTVKFAMRDFALTRIMNKHLTYPSAYNTYYSVGLPPGPICTPSSTTIDAVLDAPETGYIFFVASPEFNGYHVFATNYTDHMKYARQYQKALDSLIIARREKAAAQAN